MPQHGPGSLHTTLERHTVTIPLIPLLATLMLTAAPVDAGQTAQRSFPFELTRVDFERSDLRLTPDHVALIGLAELGAVRFAAVPLPDGRLVDLDLERVEVERLALSIRLNDEPWADALEHVGLSVWMGEVVGEPGSEVALSFSQFGSRGWIKLGGKAFHLVASPGADGDWSNGTSRFTEERTLLDEGFEPKNFCSVDDLAAELHAKAGIEPPSVQLRPTGGTLAASLDLLDLPLSIDCDYQLFQLFGDVNAEMAYMTTLLSWVSARYEEQISTVFTYPYLNFWTDPADPWTAPDDPDNNDCIDLLYEVQAAWENGNIPGGGLLGHVISGADLGCGVAWRPGLCNEPYNFSVSANIDGKAQFPIQQQPDNWDFIVIAHELGHNLDAPHTHDYCPPLDECAPSGYFGSCQTQENCTTQGTVMSYCHLCSGGFTNMTTYFHPQSALDMRAWAENNCLPLACAAPTTYCVAKDNSQGCTPAIDSSGSAALGGLDDLHVTASNVLNNKSGLLFWGAAQASTPFQGGTKCVAAPTRRTPIQNSGGNPPPDDCSGTYDFHFSEAYMAFWGLQGGDTVYAQYWSRDPASLSTTGLTDAVVFTLCN